MDTTKGLLCRKDEVIGACGRRVPRLAILLIRMMEMPSVLEKIMCSFYFFLTVYHCGRYGLGIATIKGVGGGTARL